jgi:hypothetical protein
VFLAILGPGIAEGPDAVDVSAEAPWDTMRRGFPPTT